MIVKYNNYTDNKTNCGYEVVIDKVNEIITTNIKQPKPENASGKYLKIIDSIEYYIKNPELTTIEEEKNKTEPKQPNNVLEFSELIFLLFGLGKNSLINDELDGKKQIIHKDNVDFRFLKTYYEAWASDNDYKRSNKTGIVCINLIKEKEIISILTNTSVYVMNDEGKTIQVIK